MRAQSLASTQLILLCSGSGTSWSRAAVPASISVTLDHSDPADGAKIPVLIPVRPTQLEKSWKSPWQTAGGSSRSHSRNSLPNRLQGGKVPDAQLRLGEIPFPPPSICCGFISLQVEGKGHSQPNSCPVQTLRALRCLSAHNGEP